MEREPLRYTVRGKGAFPIDMLRHDGSAPATERDRELVERLSGDRLPDGPGSDEPVSIELVMTEIGLSRPVTARWASCGWAVPGDWEHDAIERDRAEAAARRKLLDSALAKLSDGEREALAWYGLNLPN